MFRIQNAAWYPTSVGFSNTDTRSEGKRVAREINSAFLFFFLQLWIRINLSSPASFFFWRSDLTSKAVSLLLQALNCLRLSLNSLLQNIHCFLDMATFSCNDAKFPIWNSWARMFPPNWESSSPWEIASLRLEKRNGRQTIRGRKHAGKIKCGKNKMLAWYKKSITKQTLDVKKV